MINALEIKEIAEHILSFLSDQEATTFHTTTQVFHKAASSNQIIMPFLNRLKTVDNKVSVLPPQVPSETWCYERFVTEFKRIALEQEVEIQHFLAIAKLNDWKVAEGIWLDDDINVREALIHLRTLNADLEKHNLKISTLEKRHEAIERLNIALIKTRMGNADSLLIEGLNLTRIPEKLYTEDPAYWQRLVALFCQDNKLKCLPEFLGNCQMLRKLFCYNNALKTLPGSIGNLKNLFWLYCDQNQLEIFPDSLANCDNLIRLSFSDNKIQALPNKIGECKRLRYINANNNCLKALPGSLDRCATLNVLYCNRNYISHITPKLREKLGVHWYNNTICEQLELPNANQNKMKVWLAIASIVTAGFIVFAGYAFMLAWLIQLSIVNPLAQIAILGLNTVLITTAVYSLFLQLIPYFYPQEHYVQENVNCNIELKEYGEFFKATGYDLEEQLRRIERLIPHRELGVNFNKPQDRKNRLQFKQFELEFFRKFQSLKTEERKEKECHEILQQAKKGFTYEMA